LSGCAAPANVAAGDEPLPRAGFREAGLPEQAWLDAVSSLRSEGMRVDQLGVLVDGRLVASHFGAGYDEDSLHDIRSATKSVTSLLLGIAIDRGLIRGVDVPVDSFFPDMPGHSSRSSHRPITLRDLLTMRSGLDCDDWADSAGNEERMYRSTHWVRFFQAIPARDAPGGSFRYCTAGVVVLGEVIARASGKPLPAFAQEALFEPLGIRGARWADAGAGITDAGGHLQLSLGAMLKLGELTRTGGVWRGQRLISSAWLAQSLSSAGPIAPGSQLQAHMGWLWWLEPVRGGQVQSWQARGNGGQLIIVVPEVGLVVAATGHAYNAPHAVQWAPFTLLQRWLIPSLRSKRQGPADKPGREGS
jgi:CubicO group peptidase (beta-lactamase class C family)